MSSLRKPIATTPRLHRINVLFQESDAYQLAQFFEFCKMKEIITDDNTDDNSAKRNSTKRSAMPALIAQVCVQFMENDKEFKQFLAAAKKHPTENDFKRHFDSSKAVS